MPGSSQPLRRSESRSPSPALLRHEGTGAGLLVRTGIRRLHRYHGREERSHMQVLADVTSGGFIGLWAVIYVVLLITLGILSIRKGHWVMFLIGLFLPLFWLIGALLPKRR